MTPSIYIFMKLASPPNVLEGMHLVTYLCKELHKFAKLTINMSLIKGYEMTTTGVEPA